MEARELKKKRDLALSMTVAGPSITVGAYIAFFGGSDRDPEWVWAIFHLALFGGIATFIVGAFWLLILNH